MDDEHDIFSNVLLNPPAPHIHCVARVPSAFYVMWSGATLIGCRFDFQTSNNTLRLVQVDDNDTHGNLVQPTSGRVSGRWECRSLSTGPRFLWGDLKIYPVNPVKGKLVYEINDIPNLVLGRRRGVRVKKTSCVAHRPPISEPWVFTPPDNLTDEYIQSVRDAVEDIENRTKYRLKPFKGRLVWMEPWIHEIF